MTAETSFPDLDATYEVDDDCIANFRRDGHTVVRGLASSEEIAVYGPIIQQAAMTDNNQRRPIEEARHLRQGVPADREPVASRR